MPYDARMHLHLVSEVQSGTVWNFLYAVSVSYDRGSCKPIILIINAIQIPAGVHSPEKGAKAKETTV